LYFHSKEFCKIKKACLSEGIFEVASNEESHYKQRSLDRKARQISQDDKKHSILQNSFSSKTTDLSIQ